MLFVSVRLWRHTFDVNNDLDDIVLFFVSCS